jgi:hypothetical protein
MRRRDNSIGKQPCNSQSSLPLALDRKQGVDDRHRAEGPTKYLGHLISALLLRRKKRSEIFQNETLQREETQSKRETLEQTTQDNKKESNRIT